MQNQRIIVFSSLFPSTANPTAGTFIRERLFRVHEKRPIVVVAPQVWSPVDGLVRFKRPRFRVQAEEFEMMDGVEVFRPRFFSLPAVGKSLDGASMYRAARPIVAKLVKRFQISLIDSHFLYPDGWAASQLAQEFGLKLSITIRGSKDEWLIGTERERFLKEAMQRADQLFSVSAALKRDVALKLGIPAQKVQVIGNGVDLEKFEVVDKEAARKRLGLSLDDQVFISVGSLIERKGFHRLLPIMAQLRKRFPRVRLLIVGGGASHGDMTAQLESMIDELGLRESVRLCGPQLPSQLKWFYGASDAFVLATAHEGWANVFLEAMACGLPVVTTDVGGNKEVVPSTEYGLIAPYFDESLFAQAMEKSLETNWDRVKIREYAQDNSWKSRVETLVKSLDQLSN